MEYQSPQKIVSLLKNASNFLDYQQYRELFQDIDSICQQLNNPNFRIAVFAPFNFGKSTLINALLGEEIMPTGMIPKTGTIIKLKYAQRLRIKVRLQSGGIIENSNSETLNQYTILDEDENAPENISSVEVFYPYSLLKNGVELLDLPGTNAQDNEDNIVKNQMLQIDLVIQVLSASQPFSLREQENLQRWLIDKEVKSIIFAVNWMNKTENRKERAKVLKRIKKICDRFDSKLPTGLNKVYRVDALPAFKAKKTKNFLSTCESGIVGFQAALHTLVELGKKQIYKNRLPRIVRISNDISSALQKQIKNLEEEIFLLENERNAEIDKGKKQERLFRDEFNHHIDTFYNWLSLSNLTTCYQDSLARALESSNFYSWKSENLEKAVNIYINNIEQLINQVCQEFNKNKSSSLYLSLPDVPYVSLPTRTQRTFGQSFRDIFNGGANQRKLDTNYERKKKQSYQNAAKDYLCQLSQTASRKVSQYKINTDHIIVFPIPPESSSLSNKRLSLKYLNNYLEELKNIKLVKSSNQSDTYKKIEIIKLFLLFWKNWLLYLFLF